jgi:transposase
MESTGSYWKPVFEALEEDMTVVLANSEDVKGRRGHKTDWQDCRFLAHLLRHGLIRPSFIPPRAIRDLRDLTRRRCHLISDASSERNRIQKVLDEASVGIGQVLGDVFGVSGQLMLEKLLKGETDVEAIAKLAQRRAKQKIPELIRALEGHRLRDHHRTLIRLSLEHLAFLEGQLAAIDNEIARIIEENALTKAYHLLISVPGVQQISAAAILAETGADMQVFPTAGHLSSWAGVAPGNKISGGKAKPTSVSRGNRWLRTTLVECAWAASKLKDSPSKEQFAKLANKGRKVGLIAIAHSLAVIIHRTLATGQLWQAGDRPMDEAKRERLVRHYIRRLGKLGVQVYSLRPEPTRYARNSAGTVVDSRTKKPPHKLTLTTSGPPAEERNST